MIKDIQYKGHAASPSDYECSDGELAMSLNMIHEDGSLKPVMQPSDVMQLYNAAVKCVHETGAYINYIVVTDANDLGWRMKASGTYSHIHAFSSIEIYDVIPVGNTLVVSTSDGIYYFLWKENGYISLGNELPELNVTPYISTEVFDGSKLSEKFNYKNGLDTVISESYSGTGGGWDDHLYSETCDTLYNGSVDQINLNGVLQQKIYEKVFSYINPRSNILKKNGYFFEPFYVRFAYRMYDGSHVKHTVPVLMVPATMGKPLVNVKINQSKDSISQQSTTTAKIDAVYFAGQLGANIALPDDIGNWDDIITNIDIFVTEPLIDYSDNAESLVAIKKFDSGKHKSMIGTNAGMTWVPIKDFKGDDQYVKEYYVDLWFEKESDGNYRFRKMALNGLEDQYLALDCSVYYVEAVYITEVDKSQFNINTQNLKVYSVNEIKLTGERFYIDGNNYSDQYLHVDSYKIYKINPGDIAAEVKFCVETRRTDEKSYKDVLESYSSFYNVSQLNISEISSGFSGLIPINANVLPSLVTRPVLSDLGQCHNRIVAGDIFSYNSRLNAIVSEVQFLNPSASLKMQNCTLPGKTGRKIKRAYVEIYENSQTSYVEIPVGGDVDLEELFYYAFPNANAKKLYAEYKYNNSDWCAIITLKPHDFLNLAHVFNMFGMFDCARKNRWYNVAMDKPIRYGNIIRLSDVNNPFRFSEEYTVSLPVKEVYALSTAAKALSQGQFGQYPLYAFTSDGIWALELTSTGTYSARQPISRDVVINRDSITQIDNSVLFATDRGIMLISGSQVMCISDRINAADQFTMTGLPKSDILTKMFDDTLEVADIDLMPFSGFVAGCRMIYDYTHQHIIVYNPAVRYAYVYSLKSQLWGMMTCDIKDNVSSYPESLAMTSDNRLVDFSVSRSGKVSTMTVTRPISMEQPDMYKTINTVIQRGCMKDNRIKQVLYGSNDLNRWFMVWNSDNRHMGGFSGTPWKHYRIVTIREFDKDESLYGFSLQYEPRMTNRLR